MNVPEMTAPSRGTTRGWAMTPGNIRRPSFVTAACTHADKERGGEGKFVRKTRENAIPASFHIFG
jgi:hypothetical protein